MEKIRTPVVAGTFYPAKKDALRKMVEDYLAQATVSGKTPKAVIVPHAGYIYSGPVAANAYALIAQARKTIRRVVLLGPSHFVPFSGLALSTAKKFKTPLGSIEIDRDAIHTIASLRQIRYLDQAHAKEHSLEVELPFLQVVLDRFSLVPLAVGHAEPQEVSEVLEYLWGGPETLIVVSSDLSHYQDYQTARKTDTETARAIETLEYERILDRHACGAYCIRGLLRAARKYRLSARTLDLRNSGDTGGSKDSVVGYGAFSLQM